MPGLQLLTADEEERPVTCNPPLPPPGGNRGYLLPPPGAPGYPWPPGIAGHGMAPGAGRRRFWLGVLAGGCGVLVLELILFVVSSALLGSAVRSGLQGRGFLLPVPLPSGLTQLAVSSEPCGPQPCLARHGVTVLVSNVDRSASPGSGPHLVRLDVTFVGTSGTHTVTPAEFVLSDAAGTPVLPVTAPAQGCSATPVQQTLQAGQRLGPYPVCFAVRGQAGQDLTLSWIDPEGLTVVNLKVP
ncbi:MAG TPA: hypothetical protein VKF59_23070 [Candidatus Dormibacteraeota bacterium]|nr:hypothetical protein [Candidatus Dormibacteraeota bacterium]